jgi:hypothetical protein
MYYFCESPKYVYICRFLVHHNLNYNWMQQLRQIYSIHYYNVLYECTLYQTNSFMISFVITGIDIIKNLYIRGLCQNKMLSSYSYSLHAPLLLSCRFILQNCLASLPEDVPFSENAEVLTTQRWQFSWDNFVISLYLIVLNYWCICDCSSLWPLLYQSGTIKLHHVHTLSLVLLYGQIKVILLKVMYMQGRYYYVGINCNLFLGFKVYKLLIYILNFIVLAYFIAFHIIWSYFDNLWLFLIDQVQFHPRFNIFYILFALDTHSPYYQ